MKAPKRRRTPDVRVPVKTLQEISERLRRLEQRLGPVQSTRKKTTPSQRGDEDDGLPPDWESRMTSAFNGSEKGEVWRVNAKPQVAKTRFSRPSSANYQGDLT